MPEQFERAGLKPKAGRATWAHVCRVFEPCGLAAEVVEDVLHAMGLCFRVPALGATGEQQPQYDLFFPSLLQSVLRPEKVWSQDPEFSLIAGRSMQIDAATMCLPPSLFPWLMTLLTETYGSHNVVMWCGGACIFLPGRHCAVLEGTDGASVDVVVRAWEGQWQLAFFLLEDVMSTAMVCAAGLPLGHRVLSRRYLANHGLDARPAPSYDLEWLRAHAQDLTVSPDSRPDITERPATLLFSSEQCPTGQMQGGEPWRLQWPGETWWHLGGSIPGGANAPTDFDAEVLRACTFGKQPNSPLWRAPLTPHSAVWQYAQRSLGTLLRIKGVTLVASEPTVRAFVSKSRNLQGQRDGGSSLFNNTSLIDNDAEKERLLNELKAHFLPSESFSRARSFLAWHGCSTDVAEALCTNGLRYVGQSDPGYFGAGDYVALDARLAAAYATKVAIGDVQEPTPGTIYTVLLCAVVTGLAYPVTRTVDYAAGGYKSNFFGKPLRRNGGVVCDTHIAGTARATRFQAPEIGMPHDFIEVVVEESSQVLPLAIVKFELADTMLNFKQWYKTGPIYM